MNGRSDISVVLGAGSYYYDAILKSFEEDGFKPGGNIRVIEYIDDMASYLAAADLVISRSGALTVAETTVSGRAAIFIPSPMVTGNHQYYNALAVAEAGGAIVCARPGHGALLASADAGIAYRIDEPRLVEAIASFAEMAARQRME